MKKGIHFREDWGLFWPDYDASPERTYRYVQKHLADVDMTIRAANRAQRSICIQAGGHVGCWPLRLAQSFTDVLTFEPDPALFECLYRNTQLLRQTNIRCFQSALGERAGVTKMVPHEKAGSWSVDEKRGSVRVQVDTIDQIMRELALPACHAIVLDVEGFEVEALKGAKETIQTHLPVIHVEELKPHRARTSEYLRAIGYIERERAGHDALYIHQLSIQRGDYADKR